jgi:hypothetical protein
LGLLAELYLDPLSPWWADNAAKLEQICVGNLAKNLEAAKGKKPDLPVGTVPICAPFLPNKLSFSLSP